ncbi:MAG: response regulator [Rubrivivax sp.]|nr:response regulator [Rubrivivax sp.]
MNTTAHRPAPFLTEWLLLASALLVLGGLVAYSLFDEHAAIGNREAERLSAQARVVHNNFGRQLFAINRALDNVREELPVWRKEKGGMALASRRLAAFSDALTGVRTMLILDAAGNVRASSRTELLDRNFSHRDYFTAARDKPNPDTLFVSPPFKSVLGPYVFSVSRMIVGPRGEFAGVVTAAIDPEEFKILLGSVLYAPDMWAAVVHGSGTLFMMLPDREGVAGMNLATPGSLFSRHIASGQMGTVMTGPAHGRGEQRIVAHQSLNPAGLFMDHELIVAVARDRDALYVPWRRDARISGGLFGLLALSSVVGLYLLQRRRRSAAQEAAAAHAALLEAKLAAEAASRAKSQFLANMSHEIRTPMNAVLGLLQLLQHTEQTGRQQDYTQKAQAAAESLLGILNDILDFSKIDAGKMTLESAPFRLDQLLRNLSVVLSSAVLQKDVEVLFDIDAAIPRVLHGDALRLQQVLLNLAGNAIKFTAQGEVVLRLKQLASTPERVRIEFAVQDTGIGIAADQLENIFAGFTQAEASTSRRFGGTGLGLAISRRLVRLMGGELAVTSTAWGTGRGSRFAFVLEFARVTAPGEGLRRIDADAAAADQPHPLRVLIVDDNATARAVLADMVARLGWLADTADSGAAALARLAAAADGQPGYDAIFVDWQMPGMDGWETALSIRALHRDGQTPVIIMVTAHGREMLANRLDSPANPLDGFLVKPVTTSMLFDALANARAGCATALDRRAVRRPLSRPLAGLRLLLVEDNVTNQQVARELLTLQGAHVDVAGNGRLGIERVASTKRPYDAVLMDIQMPEMDGFAATQILRKEMGLLQLPIIAMTANAMPADRENCLAAGMNDHVGKPINVETLVATLLRHCGRAADAAGATDAAGAPRPQPATPALLLPELPPGFALADALTRLGNQRETYLRILEFFRQDQRALRERLRNALQQDDRSGAARELHTLKGLAGTLGASALADFARSAEAELKNGKDCATLQARLDSALDETLTVLDGVAAQFAPAPATSPVEPRADTARLCADLENLEALLADKNLRALDAHAALQKEYGATLGAKLTPIDSAIAQMDFTAALAASQALRSTLA